MVLNEMTPMDVSRTHRPAQSEHAIGTPSPDVTKAELERARAQVAAAVERYRNGGAADSLAARQLSSGVVAAVDVMRILDAELPSDASDDSDGSMQQCVVTPELAAEAQRILQSRFDDLVPNLLEGVVAQSPVPDDVDQILRAMLYLERLATHQEQGAAV